MAKDINYAFQSAIKYNDTPKAEYLLGQRAQVNQVDHCIFEDIVLHDNFYLLQLVAPKCNPTSLTAFLKAAIEADHEDMIHYLKHIWGAKL